MNMTFDDIDILIVGAGPAGAAAALSASRRKARVLVVERRETVGIPVQCAEYIPAALKGQLNLGAEYVVQKVNGMRTYVPGQAVKETAAPGYIIRRELFDQTLINAAVDAGAELRCATRATAISHDTKEVRLSPKTGAPFKVRPRVVIGADGPRSTVGSWVGATNRQLIAGVQMTLPLAAPMTHTEIYFKPEINAGYGWLFPKGKVANAGLGMRKPQGDHMSIRRVLDLFVSQLVKDGKIHNSAVGYATGWIPAEPLRSAVYGNIILVGDAAGHTHPITGAGIFNAVNCGFMAGRCAALAVSSDDTSVLKTYDEEWQELLGDTLAHAWQRRELMETKWSDFPNIIHSCWVAYREYYASRARTTP